MPTTANSNSGFRVDPGARAQAHLDAAALRERARALRWLAARVDNSVVGELVIAGGDDTWRGPTAFAFQTDARRADRMCGDAVASLRRAAQRLEVAANELDSVMRLR
jgi:hypothetical protein